MKMKRFVAAAIAAVSCLSFAACGSDTASKDENVIHIMSSGDSSANMERALVDEYNKTADVKAVLDLVTSADYQNKLPDGHVEPEVRFGSRHFLQLGGCFDDPVRSRRCERPA